MALLQKTARSAACVVAAVFIGLSGLGIAGVWFLYFKAAHVVRQGFGVIESAVGVIDAGVGRAHDLISSSRVEVKQAAETITAVGVRAEANSPVLTALSERLETRLAPRVGQLQPMLAPVRDAVVTIASAVSLASSLPGMAERAPRLVALDETFDRIGELAADSTQLRSTVRALALAQKGELTAETVATIQTLTGRIDIRLGEIQTRIESVQAEIDALQLRIAARKGRALFILNALATLATMMLAWLLFSQVIVIRHYRQAERT